MSPFTAFLSGASAGENGSLASVAEGTVWVKEKGRRTQWPGKCDTTKLQDLTLIIHCRQTPKICELRRPLLMEYVPYFKESVVFLNNFEGYRSWPLRTRHCTTGDPYWCIAQEVPLSKGSAGILYMQFDVAVSPCELAKSLDTEKIFLFTGSWYDIWADFDIMDDCNLQKKSCIWYHWIQENNKTRKQIGKIREELEKLQHSPSLRQHLSVEKQRIFNKNLERLRTGIWREISDFLYLPKRITSMFAIFAKVFEENRLFNEMATLSAVMLAGSVANVTVQNLSCVGACCKHVSRHQIMQKGFICGHRYDYTDPRDLATLQFLVSQRPWPRWPDTSSAALQPANCSAGSLKKVFVILHCTETLEHCRSRLHLLPEYAAYFPNVAFMVSEAIPHNPALQCETPESVYRCLSRLQGERYTGVLYMKLDVALSPCALLQKLQLERSAWGFGDLTEKGLVTYQELESTPGVNHTWLARSRLQLRNVTGELWKRPLGREGRGREAVQAMQRGLWQSFDGLFYIPNKVFRTYANLAEIFAKFDLEGEMASATLLALSTSLTQSGPVQNLQCAGSHEVVSKEMINAESFVCGRHGEDGETLEALDDLLVPPVWRRSGAGLVVQRNTWRKALSRALHLHSHEVALALVLIPFLSVTLLWLFRCRRHRQKSSDSTVSKPAGT
eukprot:s122_g30.t1